MNRDELNIGNYVFIGCDSIVVCRGGFLLVGIH